MRDRLMDHMEVPACASCHAVVDPIGLGLENFDAIGRYRELDNGVVIDASGDLDGRAFADAIELGEALAKNDDSATCFSTWTLRYALGHLETEGELEAFEDLAFRFQKRNHRVQELLASLVLSNAFRQAGGIETP